MILPQLKSTAQYRRPAKFNDLLEIGLTVDEAKEKAVKHGFKIYKKETAELLANGYIVAVATNRHTLKSMKIPDEIAEKLKVYYGGLEK